MSPVALCWIIAFLLHSCTSSLFESTPTLDILHTSTCFQTDTGHHLNLRWTFSNAAFNAPSILFPSWTWATWRNNVSPEIVEFRVLRPYPFEQTPISHDNDQMARAFLSGEEVIHSMYIFIDESDWNHDFEFRIGFAYNGECRWTAIYSTTMQFMLSNCMTSKNDDIPSEWMYRAPLYVAIGVGTAATAAAVLPIIGFTTGIL